MVAPHSLSPDGSAPDPELIRCKRLARLRARVARAGCDPAWGERLRDIVLTHRPPPAGAVVAGFLPLAGEIDTRPLLAALRARGHALVLPATPPRGAPLRFLEWHEDDPMLRERFGTLRPTGPERAPDMILVPLLAFDRAGRRLGYGGGYYDRTLPRHPAALRLGIGFAAQEMADVPAGPADVRLPAVATERGIIACGA